MKWIAKHVDLLAGLSSIGWGVAATYLPALALVISPTAAGVFGLAALARWMLMLKGA